MPGISNTTRFFFISSRSTMAFSLLRIACACWRQKIFRAGQRAWMIEPLVCWFGSARCALAGWYSTADETAWAAAPHIKMVKGELPAFKREGFSNRTGSNASLEPAFHFTTCFPTGDQPIVPCLLVRANLRSVLRILRLGTTRQPQLERLWYSASGRDRKSTRLNSSHIPL